jgi:hypothetical protein
MDFERLGNILPLEVSLYFLAEALLKVILQVLVILTYLDA